MKTGNSSNNNVNIKSEGRQADGMKMMMRANNIKLILFFMICVWFATSISFSCSLSTHTFVLVLSLKCHQKARADVTNYFTRRAATCISIHENPIISVQPQMCFIFFLLFVQHIYPRPPPLRYHQVKRLLFAANDDKTKCVNRDIVNNV